MTQQIPSTIRYLIANSQELLYRMAYFLEF